MVSGAMTAWDGHFYLMEEAHLHYFNCGLPGYIVVGGRAEPRQLVVLHPADFCSSQPEGESRRTKRLVFTVTSCILITDGFEFMRHEY
ncbi:unnamed protein product [Lampetra planeri]